MGIIPSNVLDELFGFESDAPMKAKCLFGTVPHKEKGVITQETSKMYDYSKYKFLVNAPFDVSNICCDVMKKNPIKKYARKTGRKQITAQMASESRLRTQQWIRNGCNGFDMKDPISNPMSFWTEQDILLYIRGNNIPICSVYGDVVTEDEATGQGNLSDYGIFDLERPCLHTTGCQRTGCVGCGYGLHLDKGENRFDMLSKTHPRLFDFFMRGGEFDEKGLWKPGNGGMGYWFVIQWINIHGGFNIHIENYEYYEKKYETEETKKYLHKK